VNFREYLGGRHEQLLTDACQHAGAVFRCVVVATLDWMTQEGFVMRD
jgi:osmoprotectant transport system permease protein